MNEKEVFPGPTALLLGWPPLLLPSSERRWPKAESSLQGSTSHPPRQVNCLVRNTSGEKNHEARTGHVEEGLPERRVRGRSPPPRPHHALGVARRPGPDHQWSGPFGSHPPPQDLPRARPRA